MESPHWYAERELCTAGNKNCAAAQRQLSAASRQLQDAIKLVMAARAVADAAANRAADDNNVAGGPRLFEGTAG